MEVFNPDFCEDKHFNNSLVGAAKIISKNNIVTIQDFVGIDPNFYSFMEWDEFIPNLQSSDIHKFLKFDLPQVLLKFFRTIFWNIKYKYNDYDNAMAKLTKGNKLCLCMSFSQKIYIFENLHVYFFD